MSAKKSRTRPAPLNLEKYRNLPFKLMAGGGLICLIGIAVDWHNGCRHFAFSWLQSFMFFLSICLGAWFLVLVHHLFDAGWSVPIRRFCEHISKLLFPCMFLLFLPFAIALAPRVYPWMIEQAHGHIDHALAAKNPLFTPAGFYLSASLCFFVWWWIPGRLRFWSLEQDKTGAALPTYKMRFYASIGIISFAGTLTLAVVMWMKALEHQWFSTMYGVYYFAGSVWLTLATVYVITSILDRQGILTEVLHEHQYYFIGSLLFAFTVFYAYVTFAQYFIIWNGNMPEETYWYVVREQSGWWYVGLVIIFGHFFVPFLGLLRIDVKSMFPYMTALAVWAWIMHYVDLSFNIKPILYPNGFPILWIWLDAGCAAFMLGVLSWQFLKQYAAHPPYPLKDPRLIEAMGHYHPVPTQISGGELDETDFFSDAPRRHQGGKT